MQIQADTLGVEVSKPVVAETTALGAAYARWSSDRVLGVGGRAARQLAGGPALGPADQRARNGPPDTRGGRRRSNERWTGSRSSASDDKRSS